MNVSWLLQKKLITSMKKELKKLKEVNLCKKEEIKELLVHKKKKGKKNKWI